MGELRDGGRVVIDLETDSGGQLLGTVTHVGRELVEVKLDGSGELRQFPRNNVEEFLCQCGMGLLALPIVETPDTCPICGGLLFDEHEVDSMDSDFDDDTS